MLRLRIISPRLSGGWCHSRQSVKFARFASSIVADLDGEPLSISDISSSGVTPDKERLQALSGFREENSIKVKGELDGSPYFPLEDFDSTPFSKNMKDSLKKQGFDRPTVTQMQSWPIALSGRDIISIAKTGSGKTLGFLIPAMHKFQKDPSLLASRGADRRADRRRGQGTRRKRERSTFLQRMDNPKILVLAPTRELVMQIAREAQKFSRTSGLLPVAIYGGASMGVQANQLASGVDVVVATPGRCLHFVEEGSLDLSEVEYLVLDEADTMLDMGFEDQVCLCPLRPFSPFPSLLPTMLPTAQLARHTQAFVRFCPRLLFLILFLIPLPSPFLAAGNSCSHPRGEAVPFL